MRKLIAVAAVLLTAAMPGAFAQHSGRGTWKYDAAHSDFGSGPKPKSMTLVITKDTPQMLAWHLTEVRSDGKIERESWSGPRDGSMQTLKRTGGDGQASFTADEGGQFTINEKTSDGTSQSQVTVSDNGNTMTQHMTGGGQGGAPDTVTIVWHKVKTAARKAAK